MCISLTAYDVEHFSCTYLPGPKASLSLHSVSRNKKPSEFTFQAECKEIYSVNGGYLIFIKLFREIESFNH